MNRNNRIFWLFLMMSLLALTACQSDEPEPTPTPTPTPAPAVGAVTVEVTPAPVECRVEPPAGWSRVAALPGDTLSALAERRGTSVEEIRRINCMESNLLVAGEMLYLPPAVCTVSPPAGWQLYIVGTGDTLTELAAKHNTTVETVVKFNCLPQAAVLDIGQTLYLPALPTPTPTVTPLPTFTPLPPPPPPTVRPTATLPLLTPTPGIVSISTPAVGLGNNPAGSSNSPGQANQNPQSNGQTSGQNSPGSGSEPPPEGGAGEPPVERTSPPEPPDINWAVTFDLGGFYGGGQALCKDAGDVRVTGPDGKIYWRVCWGRLSSTEPVTLTLTSVNTQPEISLSAIFSVELVATPNPHHVTVWRDPIPDVVMENEVFSSSTSDDIVVLPGKTPTPFPRHLVLDFDWPPELPNGQWSLVIAQAGKPADIFTLTQTEPMSPTRRTDVIFDPARQKLRPQDEACNYLASDEVQSAIQIKGTHFPTDTVVALRLYPESGVEDKVVRTDADGAYNVEISTEDLSPQTRYYVVPRWEGDGKDNSSNIKDFSSYSLCFVLPPDSSP